MKNIKSTLRYLWRNKLFTVLNVVGLAIGISACWLVFSIVQYEFAFDKKIPDLEDVYQIVSPDEGSAEIGFPGVPLALAPLLTNESLDDALVVPIYQQYFERIFIPRENGKAQLVLDEQEDIIGTNQGYFSLLPYEWIAGKAETAFSRPNNLVVTEDRARIFFPNTDPLDLVGRVVMGDTTQFVVSGVVKNLRFPHSFVGEIFIPIPTEEWRSNNWLSLNSNHQVYVKTKNHRSLKHLLKVAQKEYDKLAADKHREFGAAIDFDTFPLLEKHFERNVDTSGLSTDKKVIYGLIAIGGFLLILACINYINLSTAQVPQRAKEIGIRKTLGVKPSMLTFNFFIETWCITLISLLFSWPIVFLFRRVYPEFIPAGMDVYENTGMVVLFMTSLMVVVTVLSGLYPSYLINKVRVIETLKGKVETRIKGTRLTLRKSLIVFQFVIAQFFIVGALIIGQQLDYTLTKDLGFEHDAIVTVRMPYKSYQNSDVDPLLYKQALSRHPEVAKVAMGHEPQNRNHWGNVYYFTADTGRVQLSTQRKYIDADFIDLYQIKLLAGRNIQFTDTLRDIMINEAALKALGLNRPEEALGKFLVQSDNVSLPIVGVYRDFHQKSLQHKIEPLLLGSSSKSSQLQTFHVKLPHDRKQWSSTFSIMEAEWKKLYPEAPFTYQFLDEKIENLYESQHRMAKLIDLATGVTILISCLGLFGLATLTAFQRTKEIGIRKVLGASVSGIVGMLSRDFVKLVLIAVIIASPIAWWAMNKWLEDFAYRIEIQWWIFGIAGVLALTIALLTVSGQAIRAATANPVKSLRDE